VIGLPDRHHRGVLASLIPQECASSSSGAEDHRKEGIRS
jgi:hypothetical protein